MKNEIIIVVFIGNLNETDINYMFLKIFIVIIAITISINYIFINFFFSVAYP